MAKTEPKTLTDHVQADWGTGAPPARVASLTLARCVEALVASIDRLTAVVERAVGGSSPGPS